MTQRWERGPDGLACAYAEPVEDFRVDANLARECRAEAEERGRDFAAQASKSWLKLLQKVKHGAPAGMTHWRLTGTEQFFDPEKLQVIVTNKIEYGRMYGVDEASLLNRGWTKIA